MKYQLRILFFLLSFPVLGACNKQGDPPGSTVQQCITGSIWTKTEYWIDSKGDGNFETDLEDCFSDNTWQFETGGTYLFAEGPTRCDPGLSDILVNGKWTLKNGDATLVLIFENPNGSEEKYDFQIVSCSDARIEFVTSDSRLPKEKYILSR